MLANPNRTHPKLQDGVNCPASVMKRSSGVAGGTYPCFPMNPERYVDTRAENRSAKLVLAAIKFHLQCSSLIDSRIEVSSRPSAKRCASSSAKQDSHESCGDSIVWRLQPQDLVSLFHVVPLLCPKKRAISRFLIKDSFLLGQRMQTQLACGQTGCRGCANRQ